MPGRGARIVKRIFQCLRERDASGRETRRPTSLWELCAVAEASSEEALAVLECFRREGRSFLMPPMSVNLRADRDVDITHESLLRQWKRLLGPLSEEDEGWLAEEEESRRIILRLADRVEQQTQESTDYLRGPLLQLALEWWDRRKPNKAWAVRYTLNFDAVDKFLRESKENKRREAELEAERREKEDQTRVEKARREEELERKQLKVRIAYVFGILALVVAVVTIALLGYAMRQGTIAREKERFARDQRQLAITAEANLLKLKAQQQFEIAAANAKEQEREKQEAAKDAANAKSALDEIEILFLALEAASVGTEGQSAPLGMLLAAESMRRRRLIENQAPLSNGLLLLPKLLWELPTSAIQIMTFSPDGLLVTAGSGLVQVWDPIAKKQVKQFPIAGMIGAIAVSHNGELLGIAYDEGKQGIIRVYNLRTGEIAGERPSVKGFRHLLVGSNGNLTAFNGSLYHWQDWSDPGGLLPGSQDVLTAGGAVATSSDLNLLGLFDRDQSRISIRNLSNGNENWWPVDQTSITDIVFDPSDETHLASFDSSGIKLWDARSHEPKLTIQAGSVNGIEFSVDGRFLAASGSDGTVKVWDTRDGRAIASGFTKPGAAATVALDGANRIIAVTQKASTQLWQIAEVPLPTRIIAAQIPEGGGLAILRTAQLSTLFWKISDGRAEPPVDLSPIKTVLGVLPEFPSGRRNLARTQASCVLCGSKMIELEH